MLGFMGGKRVIIYMPDELLSALNRVTERSPQSRSEIISEAVQRYLAESPSSLMAASDEADGAFFDRVAEMMQSGLLQPGDFAEPAPEQSRPKSKLWIN
ncbi:MAG: ribbon-helix-helix protein, CopG family [Chloroflexi bacterium]|nr:MAG: ribbon-helix-helix protein, CopG family [Chloroflexota bacterium]